MTTFTLTTPGRNAACNGFVDAMDVGAGTQSDLVIATAASGTDLCTIGLGATAFGAAATGVATMTAASPSATASAAGTAVRFRLQDQDNNKLAHGDVGTTGTTMDISNTTIGSGDTITITSMTVTMPAA